MGVPLFGQEHVDRYRATDGEEGHDWQGTSVLLLTTTGRISGARRTATGVPYDEFQAGADHEIPVVVLEPR